MKKKRAAPRKKAKAAKTAGRPASKAARKATLSPRELLEKLPEPRRSEMKAVDALIRKTLPDQKPIVLHGMLGYGPFHYKYPTGREGDWFRIGLASRASYIALYACGADSRGYVAERYRDKLPKAKIGKSCVTFKKLGDLDEKTLVALLEETVRTGFGM